MPTLPPNLERRETPRPVPVASAFVQLTAAGNAQWICAMCGRLELAPGPRVARADAERHLDDQHAGWVLYAGPGREPAIVAAQAR